MSNLAIRSIARQVRDLNVAKRGATSLYVDGTNGSDNKTGESWRQALATIQEAVDVADAWTQIFIKAGVYAENVTVATDSISLIGQSRDSVKIAPATGTALTISDSNFGADFLSTVSNETEVYSIEINGIHCTLSNIAVAATLAGDNGVYVNASYSTLHQIYASDALLGLGIIFAAGLHDAEVADSYLNLTYFGAFAIGLSVNADDIIIRNNTIKGSSYGVRAFPGSSNNAIFHNNFLSVATPIIGSDCSFFENYYSDHTNIDNGFGIATEPYTNGSTTDPRPVVARNGWRGLSWADANQVALASVCTDARLAELGAANLPADIDSILTNQRKRWNWNCLTDDYMAIAGTWAVETDTDQYLGKLLHNTSSTQNDEIAIPFFAFSTDAVTLNCRCHTDVGGGGITVYVDGTSQGMLDTRGNATHNVIKTLSITPARAGLNVMRLKVTNGTFGYDLKFSELWLS